MTSANPPETTQIDAWDVAERNAAEWMRYFGFHDARCTNPGADGGVDIRSSGAIAQVKYEARLVGRPQLQQLVGARGTQHSTALLFFTGSGYASTAVTFANQVGIALFKYNLSGQVLPINAPARTMYRAAEPGGEHEPTLVGYGWLDFRASLHDVRMALGLIHAGGGGKRADTAPDRVTIAPNWARAYPGFRSVAARLERVQADGEALQRVHLEIQVTADADATDEVIDGAHKIGARVAERLESQLGPAANRGGPEDL